MEQDTYLNPTQEAGKDFYMRQIQGNVFMLNLLKFREIADYSDSPEIAPSIEITGKEAYQLYINHTLPFLKEAGSHVIFYGKGGKYLIGPESENWDAILLVKHESTAKFIAFAANEDYLKGAGHRNAALKDSSLLPIEEEPFL